MIAFVQLLNYITLPIEKLPALYSTRKASAALMEKGEAALHVKEESLPEKTVTKFRQAVALEHVSFSYEEGKKVLSDINIRFERESDMLLLERAEREIHSAAAVAGI